MNEPNWKLIAAYLATCHAATLEGLPKSTPKSSRHRHASICRKAAAFMRGIDSPPRLWQASDESIVAKEIERCENAVKDHGGSP